MLTRVNELYMTCGLYCLLFKSTPTQFQTIIYASAVTSNVGDVSEIKLIERQQNMIKENPSVSAKQMSETLSVSSRTIERDLSLMKKMAY